MKRRMVEEGDGDGVGKKTEWRREGWVEKKG